MLRAAEWIWGPLWNRPDVSTFLAAVRLSIAPERIAQISKFDPRGVSEAGRRKRLRGGLVRERELQEAAGRALYLTLRQGEKATPHLEAMTLMGTAFKEPGLGDYVANLVFSLAILGVVVAGTIVVAFARFPFDTKIAVTYGFLVMFLAGSIWWVWDAKWELDKGRASRDERLRDPLPPDFHPLVRLAVVRQIRGGRSPTELLTEDGRVRLRALHPTGLRPRDERELAAIIASAPPKDTGP